MNSAAKKSDGTASYDLIIDWGDGSSNEHVSGTAVNNNVINHTYPTSNTNYQITIKPYNTSELGWGKGFGFSTTANDNKAKMVSLNSPITKNMWIDNGDNNSVGSSTFSGCTNLTMNETFNLPQDIETIGTWFCSRLFENCTSLTMNSIFNLPQNISGYVGDYFAYNMFASCENLTMNSIFNLPPQITSTGIGFCFYIFFHDSNLVLNNVFQLPQNLTTIGTSFCYGSFITCSKITTGVTRFFGNLVLSQTEINKKSVFSHTFQNCTSLLETISASTIPQLTIVPSTTNNCFYGCPSGKITNCPSKWK